MMNPNDMDVIFREHEMRVADALRHHALWQQWATLQPTPLYRRWIARTGDLLVSLGSRLQAADDPRHSPARLDTLGNVQP